LLALFRVQLLVQRYFWTIYVVLLAAAATITSQIIRLLVESGPMISSLEWTPAAVPNMELNPLALDGARLASLVGFRDGGNANQGALLEPDNLGPTRSSLGVKLIGTLGGVAERWALASLDVGGRAHSFGVGDKVEGAEIIDIERDRVIVLNQSRHEFIDRGPGAVDLHSSSKPELSKLGNSIRALSPTEFEIPRPELDNIVADINTVATQARSVPVFKDGQMRGLRLFGIHSSSVFDRLGMSNGDVVTRINGEQLDSVSKGLQLFTKLQEARRIDVDFEHDGAAVRKTYYIR
jgi:general secretion pathway protein C